MKISKFLMFDLDLLFDVFEVNVLKMLNFCCSAWMSGFIGSIVEVVPRNLGVGLSWWSGSEHGGQVFWVPHFLQYRKSSSFVAKQARQRTFANDLSTTGFVVSCGWEGFMLSQLV